jgi:hypothetical protein
MELYEITIADVKIIKGYSLNRRWKSDMQLITDDKGNEFIDNLPGKKFGSGGFEPGYDWKPCKGKTISGVKIIENSRFKWVNKCGKQFVEKDLKSKKEQKEPELSKEDIERVVDDRVVF